jgi:hypothetical protein
MHCKHLNGCTHELIWGVYGLELMWKNAVMINLKCYVDWNVCDKNLSWPIWSTILIWSDGRRWCRDIIWGAFWIGAYSEIMLSWNNMKCYVDSKGCGRNISGPTWSNLLNRIDYKGWCHNLIWGDMWIWTDDIGFCIDQIYIVMRIGKPVTSSFHEHFEVICGS